MIANSVFQIMMLTAVCVLHDHGANSCVLQFTMLTAVLHFTMLTVVLQFTMITAVCLLQSMMLTAVCYSS